MQENDSLYKTKFSANAQILEPTEFILKEAKASLGELISLFPKDIDPQTDPDLLYVVANLCVAGVLNLNDDGLSIEESISVYKKFEKKQANLEHDRTQIVGFILKAGLSEFGTDRPISEAEAKSSNKPFNIAVVIAIWKVAAKELCEFLLDKSGESGTKELSLSFEVGFDKYQIIELAGDSVNFNEAEKIIYQSSSEFNSYDACLKTNGGSGKKNGNRIGRSLCGRVLPLGAGIVTDPAANVKGILPITTKTSDEINDNASASPFAQPPTQPFAVPAKMKKIKLSEDKIKAFKAKFTASVLTANDLTVTLKSGKKIKLANYDNGNLEVPTDSDFEESDIISIDPSKTADQSQVDNSPIVHPHVDQVYPNVDEKTQKKNEEAEKQRKELREKDYKDASGKLLELIDKLNKTAKAYFDKNTLKNGVLKSTTSNNFMINLEKLNEIKAKVASTDDPTALKESIANTVMFAEELAKKSEEMEAAFADHKKLMEEAQKQKADAEKLHESVKHEMEALKHKLNEMEEGHKAAESERKFNARMSKLEADYDMDDASKSHIAKDMAAMNDEEYASYEMKLSALMKEKSKTYKQELANKFLSSTHVKKEDESEASLIQAIASAKENIIDSTIDNTLNTNAKTLKEQMKEAFGVDVKIGGETIKDLNEKRKKSLE